MSDKRRKESTIENEIAAYIRRVHGDQASALRRTLVHKEVRTIERERYDVKAEIEKIERERKSKGRTEEAGEITE